MFLEPLIRRNGALIETAIGLHQEGRIPAGSYVLDLDVMRRGIKAGERRISETNHDEVVKLMVGG